MEEGALVEVCRWAAELNYAPREVEGSMAVPDEIASVKPAALGLFLENWELVSLWIGLQFLGSHFGYGLLSCFWAVPGFLRHFGRCLRPGQCLGHGQIRQH